MTTTTITQSPLSLTQLLLAHHHRIVLVVVVVVVIVVVIVVVVVDRKEACKNDREVRTRISVRPKGKGKGTSTSTDIGTTPTNPPIETVTNLDTISKGTMGEWEWNKMDEWMDGWMGGWVDGRNEGSKEGKNERRLASIFFRLGPSD
ncbi:hypothetical protein M0804_009720 [Polistes exclamans]|nr:hypothetical protein M0804_009720 [Polistes exclamans]